MKKAHAILTALFISVCFAVHAQGPTDGVKAYLGEARKQSNSAGCIPVLFTADSLAKAVNDIAGRAAIYDQLSSFYYNRDADKCIMYLQKAREFYNEVDNKKRASLCLNNIAFAYENRKKNNAEALKYTRLAIQEQAALKDTMQQANMYKYMGMLQGKLHQFKEAKKSVATSIMLFSSQKNQMGIAVAYRDLASIFEDEHMPDSCIINLVCAKMMWQVFSDTSRIFNLNNTLLRVYIAANKLKEATTVFKENKAILAVKPVYFKDRADFYNLGNKFLTREKNAKEAKIYLQQYTAIKDSLKRVGIGID